jgi:zinc protease
MIKLNFFMRKTCLLIACAFSFAAQAQKHLPSNVFHTKLSNGLEVLVIEDNSVPLATIEIAVKNGSYTEDDEFNGLSHMFEHMFFKANRTIPSQEKYLDRIHELGMVFNGTTAEERVNYFFTFGSKNLMDGLKFMNDAIRFPLFLQQEMKNENPVVDGEFQRFESSPFSSLQISMGKKMWGKYYSRKNPIGDHNIILTCTTEKMKIIKDKYYHPNNSVLAVGGNVKHEEVFAMAQKLFGDWQKSDFDPFQKYPVPNFDPLKAGDTSLQFVVTNDNARVPVYSQAYHGPDILTDLKNTYVADVFSTVLGSRNSKFQQMLVDSGYALQVNVNYQTLSHVGPISLIFVPNPAKFKEGFKAFQKMLDQFDADDFITDEQLELAKTKMSNDDKYNNEVTSNYVHSLTYNWCVTGLDYGFTYVDEIKKVTKADIKAYVQKYIKGKPCVQGLLMPTAMQKSMNVSVPALFQ